MKADVLPQYWRQTTLGEIAAPIPNAIVDGPFGSNLKLSDYIDEGVPVLQGKNITNDSFRWFDVRFISDRKATELKRSSVRVGDILIIKIGSIGYSAIVDDLNGFDFAIIPANLAKVTPDATKVDLGYLQKWLTSVEAKRYLVGAASKTAQPALSLGKIRSLPLPLPPLAEQRRIAEVLDRAEALRAKRRAALAQLDTFTQSLFLDLFGDPATNPKSWPKVELGEVVKLVGGYAFKSEDFAAKGNAVVRISNLTGDGIDLDGIARIPDDKLGKGVGYRIHPGDIVIAMSGATTGKLGVVPLELSEDLYLNQRVGNYRIRDAARIQREFLLGLLRSSFYQRFLWQLAAGVAQPNVSGWQLESAVVSLPPIELQREFARGVTAVEALKTAQRASLAELDALFATLQHRAFRGEL